MSETLFISDLHLSPERPGAVALFLGFLRERATQAQQVYILGDLFDAWIGDDDDTPPYPEIIAAMRALSDGGTEIFFMSGNRDFLVGRVFARATGCTLLKDPTVIDLYGTLTLLMHGDLLCTDDTSYHRFRRKIRNPIVIRLFLFKSLKRRRAIAAAYRNSSGRETALKAAHIMDANQETVALYLRNHDAERLIHGHTHRPADHRFELRGKPVSRLVLADWQENRGEVLACSERNWRREIVQ